MLSHQSRGVTTSPHLDRPWLTIIRSKIPNPLFQHPINERITLHYRTCSCWKQGDDDVVRSAKNCIFEQHIILILRLQTRLSCMAVTFTHALLGIQPLNKKKRTLRRLRQILVSGDESGASPHPTRI